MVITGNTEPNVRPLKEERNMKFDRCFGCMEEIHGYPCPVCGFDPAQAAAPNYVLPYGAILNGRYIVGKMLGRGGFGITYIGFDLMLQRKVAVKEYFPSGQVSRISPISTELQWLDGEQADQLRENGVRACLREARKMAKIGDIPEVVRVLDCFQENDTAYIVMDYVSGKTLMSVLLEQDAMTWTQAKEIFVPAMQAMEQVHQAGLVHRDISPDNLMLTPDGRVMILDLGAAKDLAINKGASSAMVVKGGFSPPEQYAQQGGSGSWTDVYAMAATMYHSLTGVVPPHRCRSYAGRTRKLGIAGNRRRSESCNCGPAKCNEAQRQRKNADHGRASEPVPVQIRPCIQAGGKPFRFAEKSKCCGDWSGCRPLRDDGGIGNSFCKSKA